ncbi:MAG TPA: CbiQ family ECF transporter T component, partial [Acidimicrobiales bacterium]|nr:CbiQ family ECF transporter T component [Acidimicrobiales bacterium]
DPKRALRTLPGALYELGVAVVVAVSVAPQLVESVQRVRRARRLRGGATARLHALRAVAIPVLVDAFDRSLRLAAAMDTRGYGRTAGASPRARQATGTLMVVGMAGLCLGAYGLTDAQTPGLLGLTALVAGVATCVAGLVLGGRRVRVTRYRPDPWTLPEWLVVVCGALPAAALVAGAGGTAALHPATDPVVWPTLPLVPTLCVLAAGLAALVSPPPRRAVGAVGVAGVPRHARADMDGAGDGSDAGADPVRSPELEVTV